MKLKFCQKLFSEWDFSVFDTLRSSTVLSQSMRACYNRHGVHSCYGAASLTVLKCMAGDHPCKPLWRLFVSGFSVTRSGLDLLGAGLDHWRSMVYFHKQVVWNRRVFNAGNFQITEQLTPGRWEGKWLQIAHCTKYANDYIYTDRNSRRPLSSVWMHAGVTRKRSLVHHLSWFRTFTDAQ